MLCLRFLQEEELESHFWSWVKFFLPSVNRIVELVPSYNCDSLLIYYHQKKISTVQERFERLI